MRRAEVFEVNRHLGCLVMRASALASHRKHFPPESHDFPSIPCYAQLFHQRPIDPCHNQRVKVLGNRPAGYGELLRLQLPFAGFVREISELGRREKEPAGEQEHVGAPAPQKQCNGL